jgi:ABC-type transporter Mla subunit MlaD
MFKLSQRDKKFQRTVGALLVVSALAVLGGIHIQRQAVSPFGQTVRIQFVVPRADGMAVKSPVTMAGIKVGWVDDLALTAENQVLLTLEIDSKVKDKLRTDSLATVTKPMLGTAFVDIQMGHTDQAVLPSGARMPGHIQPDLNDIVATLPQRLDKVERTLDTLNALSQDLRRLTHTAQASSQSLGPTLGYLQSTSRKADQAADKMLGTLDEAQATLVGMQRLMQTTDGVLGQVQAESRQFGPVARKVDAVLDDLQVLTKELRTLAPQLGSTVASGRHAAQEADEVLHAAKKSILLRGEFAAPAAPPWLPTPR